MKRLLLAVALFCSPVLAAPEDEVVAARRSALDLAGAWTNDGFKLRDGYASGTLKAGESKLVRVNLYAGNQYWFTAAAPKAKKIAVQVFDETGKPATFEPYQDESRAAAGFAPTSSGPYLVRVSAGEGESGTFALVYSYK